MILKPLLLSRTLITQSDKIVTSLWSRSFRHFDSCGIVSNFNSTITRSFAHLSKPLLLPLDTKSKSKTPNVVATYSSSKKQSPSVEKSIADDKKGKSRFAAFLQLPDHNKEALQHLKKDNAEWRTVYKFSHIKTAHVVQRFKLYQTAFTCFFVVPTSFGCYLYGVGDSGLILMTSVACGLACSMLYIMGTFFSRLIGFIYVTDKDPDIVRVAHMTFWGRRKDDLFLKTDFVPFSELPDNIMDSYIHVKTYSEPENKLYLSLKFGEVYEHEDFEEIFGKLYQIPVAAKKSSKT